MNDHDDTKTRTAYLVASSPDGGHFVARAEDGKLVPGMTYEHAVEHHPEAFEAPGVEFVRLVPRPSRARGGGVSKATTDAYRDGWDRLFGGRAAGEA